MSHEARIAHAPLLDLRLADCMDVMAATPDKHFDLAIVDPPYGLQATGNLSRMNGPGKLAGRAINTMNCAFDLAPPPPEYFDELFRISRNQIIWGGNYFPLPPTRGIIWWDKMQPWENFSAGELAWTSFDRPARQWRFDNRTTDKIHPTQKPVALYRWLLANYAKPGDTIFDSHLGSMSIAIACHYAGHPLTGCEIDPDYHAAGIERVARETRQLTLPL
jgi:site-specific DNA-methyltransferase (adenine-specific)